MTRSPFARTAAEIGAALAAASTTISYAHQEKITAGYARASFVEYRAELAGVAASLPTLDGAPDPAALRALLDLLEPASRAVADPCLNDGCNWRAQVNALDRAGAAFRAVGGG